MVRCISKGLIYSYLCASFFSVTWCMGGMGPGLYNVKNIKECENADQYELQISIERKKYNRTHDSFNGHTCFPEDLDDKYGIIAEIFKLCDGGYKFQQTIEDKNACKFIEEHSKENLIAVTTLAGISSDCPISKGCHTVENFILNYEDLPEQCLYGEFLVLSYLVKDDVKLACISVEIECEPKDKGPGF